MPGTAGCVDYALFGLSVPYIYSHEYDEGLEILRQGSPWL